MTVYFIIKAIKYRIVFTFQRNFVVEVFCLGNMWQLKPLWLYYCYFLRHCKNLISFFSWILQPRHVKRKGRELVEVFQYFLLLKFLQELGECRIMLLWRELFEIQYSVFGCKTKNQEHSWNWKDFKQMPCL